MPNSNAVSDLVLSQNATQRRSASWGLWLKWTIATATGWAVGSLAYSGLIHALDQAFFILMIASFGVMAGAIFAGIISAMFGLMQGLVIRQIGISPRRWMSASITGGIIGGVISAGAIILFPLLLNPIGSKFHWLYSQDFAFLTDTLLLAMCGLVTGRAIGYRQRRILSDSFSISLHWAKINAFGWAIGCATVVPASWLLYGKTLYPFWGIVGNYAGQSITTVALCGLVGGAITGYPLMHALQRSAIQNPE